MLCILSILLRKTTELLHSARLAILFNIILYCSSTEELLDVVDLRY